MSEQKVERITYRSEWYDRLVMNIKVRIGKHEIDLIRLKHWIGEQIVEHELYWGKPEYGNKTIVNLANDLNYSKTELYDCVKFYREYPDFEDFMEQFSDNRNLTWFYVTHRILGKRGGVEKPKEPWECSFCHQKFLEETKTNVILCPYCVMELQAWLAERKVENEEAS